MKKIFIGIAVLAALVAYSLVLRNEQSKDSTASSTSTTTTIKESSSDSSDSESVSTSSGSGSTGDDLDTSSSTDSTSQSAATSAESTGAFTDGTYTGSTENAYYGNVVVEAVVSGGKLTEVNFLSYPDSHSTSERINQRALPQLEQEAISIQSADVDTISGATYTSEAFIQSLRSALTQAS